MRRDIFGQMPRNSTHTCSADFAIKAMHPQAGLIALFQSQPFCGNCIEPQLPNSSIEEPTDWAEGLLREIVENRSTSLGLDCSERHYLVLLNQCLMGGMHRWGARGRVFESLRPDHIFQRLSPVSQESGFFVSGTFAGLFSSCHPPQYCQRRASRVGSRNLIGFINQLAQFRGRIVTGDAAVFVAQ